jgi:hypothetical protein
MSKQNFDFWADREKADKIEDLRERLVFMKTRLARAGQYKEYLWSIPIEDTELELTIRLYQSEIDHIEDLISSQQQQDVAQALPDLSQQFILSDRRKADFIRILNAMWEIRILKKPDGTIPDKTKVMQVFGNLVGVNLEKDYSSHLHQAYSHHSTEVNLKVFEQMIEATKKAIEKVMEK